MAKQQFFDIKYPFTNDSVDCHYVDLNENDGDRVVSTLLHLIFTVKGQKLRDPEFGTNLIKYLFEPNDSLTLSGIKEEISGTVKKYIPNLSFDDMDIYDLEDHSRVISIDYSITKGRSIEKNNITLPI